MLTFESPWYFLGFIPLLFLFYWQRKSAKKREGLINISSSSLISNRMKKRGRNRILYLTAIQYLTLILIISGLSRPRLIDSMQETNIDIVDIVLVMDISCLLYTSPSPRDVEESRMPSSA